MDKPIMDFNMGLYDRVNRLVLGCLLLIAMMDTNNLPPWLTLFTLYPILTAITAWDPVYAVLIAARRSFLDKFSIKESKLALE